MAEAMRFWPFSRKAETETRSGGGYSDAIVAAIEASSTVKVSDVSGTAALEAASGALSMAFASAEVDGPSWAQDAVNPVWLAQAGRSLIREGSSLSVILMHGGGVELIPAAFWNFEQNNPGRADEREGSWQCRVTTYGPSSTRTRLVGRDRLVFIRWGTSPGMRYQGKGPTAWASTTAQLQGEIERNLASEGSMPVGSIFPLPEGFGAAQGEDAEDGELEAELEGLRKTLAASKGDIRLLESTAGGWEQGKTGAPQRDWMASHFGAEPTVAAVELGKQAFARMLAACGCSPAMFDDSDGTAKREALRQFHLGTVRPLAKILEYELTLRLGVPIKLKFDNYPVDLAGRATAFRQLVSQGVDVTKALAMTGLLMNDE